MNLAYQTHALCRAKKLVYLFRIREIKHSKLARRVPVALRYANKQLLGPAVLATFSTWLSLICLRSFASYSSLGHRLYLHRLKYGIIATLDGGRISGHQLALLIL